MAISVERMRELLALHDELMRRCQIVDDKYSLIAVEPHLDMPDSLNLVKLVFEPKTPEQLNEIAEQAVAVVMLSKQRSVERSYSSSIKSISLQKSQLNSRTEAKSRAALADFNNEKASIERKVIDNGLYFSNVANRYNAEANKRYNENMMSILSESSAENELLARKEADAEALYNESVALLEEERTARIGEKLQKLADSEEKERLAIEKYNNSLEEKEQRYQYSKAKAYEAAFRAQQNKALQNAKIYAELGEVGYRDLIEKEKYAVCTDGCAALTRSEGNAIISFDSFFKSSLGNYYSAFVNWINTVLPPD